MSFKGYLSSKAAGLCLCGVGEIVWGIFAFFAGANAVLLWGGEISFSRLRRYGWPRDISSPASSAEAAGKMKSQLKEIYLLGELLPKPRDGVEREYFEVMKEVSRSAIGAAENAVREKEEYCEYVESWIHEIKTPLTACSLILANGGDPAKLKRELKRADNLTETILYYARLRSPAKDTSIAEVSAAAVVAEAVKSQRELLVAAKIGVETTGDFSVYYGPESPFALSSNSF